MEEKEIKNGDVYGKLDFDSDEKVVFPTEVTMVKIDNRDVELPVEALNDAGWRKVNDDENVVKKVKLSEGWATFMEENKHLPFSYKKDGKCFTDEAINAFREMAIGFREKQELLGLLSLAYFNGYTVKKEPKYYIKFPFDRTPTYLNVNKVDSSWKIDDKRQTEVFQTQFTLKEVDELQRNDQALGLNLNALTVKVPDGELED